MILHRTGDINLIRGILTHPEVYRKLGDDYLGPADEFEVNENPLIWYVAVGSCADVYGMFTLMPQNSVCWEVHVAMLPWTTTDEKWEAARLLAPWIARHTICRRLTASVPAGNKAAIIYGTHGIGMRYVGRQQKAFMKDGKLQDLVILGLSV